MIESRKKTSSSKQILDVQVEHIHSSKAVNVFKVNIKEGIFTVLDYKDRFGKSPDTEIYYSRYTDSVSPNSKEYKAANQVVTNFLQNKQTKDK